MKFTTATSLLALAASPAFSAPLNTRQDDPSQPQSGAFALKVVNSADPTLNGGYLSACHAGAAVEGLCAGPYSPNSTITYSDTFYFNSSLNDAFSWEAGQVVWNLPISGLPDVDHLSQPLGLGFQNLGSNVQFPLFQPGYSSLTVGFGEDKKLFVPNYGGDDSLNTPNDRPPTTDVVNLSNWHVCWGAVGGYYYQALAWVTTGAPHNPTCVKVDIEREDL